MTAAATEAVTERPRAVLYRMATPDHLCPYGQKSRYLLEKQGFEVEDHLLTSREETEAFKHKHGVETTPQTWIAGVRVGGYDDLRERFGLKDDSDTSYRPVIAIFAIAALLAGLLVWLTGADLLRGIEWFVALAMVLLALQKLQDVEKFSTMVLNYDLLARAWVPYGYAYPYLEALAGLLMVGGLLPWLSGPVALVIGLVGAVSVFKAVYLDGRELKCACVGGDSKVPLGFVSLSENLAMIAMGVWTLVKLAG
ncbi:MauE/DoxX family redox-associated membrane protein [Seohaeicola zhoushanensis]|uniref:Methylamine utilization protein MauE n=1 Tax=Seohaeicola zhoushanensis TaxID=1569283 RepID=A0A8J3M669_9RHOB|nr:glutaredoxin [Seohaeicola zhoushanensis]GHF40315.1 membrane protein [Seohaeicola zhoushanensis]